ncbi:MAG: class I SAM-dependent methyltransferase [Thermoanaerobaculia bacterium]
MSHRSTGIYRIFESAVVYESFQRLLGSDAARRRYVRELLRPSPGSRILDIGCGPGTIRDYLPQDVDYAGYDLNWRYIEEARRRYPGRGRFFCARVEDAPDEPGGFDLVLATAILHHLDDSEAGRLVASAWRHLRPGGSLVTLDPVRHPGQSPVARLLVALDRGRRVRTPEGYRALAAARFPSVETTLLTDLIPIPYSHLLMRASKPSADT